MWSIPDRDSQSSIRRSTFVEVVLTPGQVDEPRRVVPLLLLEPFLAGPQTLRADQCHSFNADLESVIDERSYLFKGWIGYDVWPQSPLPCEEIVAGAYVVAQNIDIEVLFNRVGKTPVSCARFPGIKIIPI